MYHTIIDLDGYFPLSFLIYVLALKCNLAIKCRQIVVLSLKNPRFICEDVILASLLPSSINVDLTPIRS